MEVVINIARYAITAASPYDWLKGLPFCRTSGRKLQKNECKTEIKTEHVEITQSVFLERRYIRFSDEFNVRNIHIYR